MSQSATGVKCNRCQTDGLGWCVSRSSGRHYLAYLVPTQIVRDSQIVIENRPQPNLLHKCGKTLEDARQAAADYAAERARIRAMGSTPQPIAQTATAAPVAAKAKGKAKAPAASVAAIRQRERANGQPVNAQVLPFKTETITLTPVVGPVEAAVTAAQAIVPVLMSKGLSEPAARAMVASMTPADLAGLLLKL